MPQKLKAWADVARDWAAVLYTPLLTLYAVWLTWIIVWGGWSVETQSTRLFYIGSALIGSLFLIALGTLFYQRRSADTKVSGPGVSVEVRTEE